MHNTQSTNNQITFTVVNLLNEIGHELKNKIGVIGTVLKDLKTGYPTDEDSLDDSLKLYEQIIGLANLISQNITVKVSEGSSNSKHGLEVLDYIKSLAIEVIKYNQKSAQKFAAKEITLFIQINDNIVSENISISEDFMKKLYDINIFKNPENSSQKILTLQLNLLKEIYNYESIRFQFKSSDNADSLDFLV